MRRVPEKVINLSKIYNASKWHTLYYFKKGYIIESILSSLKISAPLSVVGAIVGEYIIAGENKGIGLFICSNLQPGAYISRYVGIILSTILGMVFYWTAFIIHKSYEKSLHINK